MAIRHFLLTREGSIEEFSDDEAVRLATGAATLPRFAEQRLRYVQVAVEEPDESGQIQVRTLGAVVGFDAEGRVHEAGTPDDDEALSHFEHDACVQFALKDTIPGRYALN